MLWTLASCKQESLHLLPTVGFTVGATVVTDTSAECGGVVLNAGGASLIEKGICISIYENPTISDIKIPSGLGLGPFSSFIKKLTPNTTYYVRAYATNEWGTAYGQQISFTTLNPNYATFTTPAIAGSVKTTSATISVNMTSPGGSLVSEYGVCWSTFKSPTITANRAYHLKGKGVTDGRFNITLANLSKGTLYYLCAYAINSSGISYSPTISFITPLAAQPTIQSPSITRIGINSATLTVNFRDAGENGPLTFAGACYSKNHITDIHDSSTTIIPLAQGIGLWSIDLQGLEPGTTYYLKTLVSDSRQPKDTILGALETSFKTLMVGLPVIRTLAPKVIDIQNRIGILYAELISDGGSPILEKGFCYDNNIYSLNTNGNNPVKPPITLRNTAHIAIRGDSALGLFSKQIQGMCISDGTISLRAYAINANGITYGKWYCASNYGAGACNVDST